MKPILHSLFVTLALTTLACDFKQLGIPTPGFNPQPDPPGFNPQPDPPGFNPQPDPPG